MAVFLVLILRNMLLRETAGPFIVDRTINTIFGVNVTPSMELILLINIVPAMVLLTIALLWLKRRTSKENRIRERFFRGLTLLICFVEHFQLLYSL